MTQKEIDPRRVSFTYYGIDIVVNDNIILADDDSNLIFKGTVISVKLIEYNSVSIITAVGGSYEDLGKPYGGDFDTASEADIITEIINSQGRFLYIGTLEDSTNNHTVSYKNRKVKPLFENLEPTANKKLYFDVEGKTNLDDADVPYEIVGPDFKKNITGALESDTDDYTTSSCTVSIEDKEGHNDAVKMIATANSGFAYISFDEVTVSAVYDSWIYIPDGLSDIVYVVFRDGGSNIAFFQFEPDYDILTNTNQEGTSDSGVNYTPDTWFHVSFEWTKSGAVDFIIDGVSIENGKTIGANDIDRVLHLFTANGDFYWIDSVGFDFNSYIQFSNYYYHLDDNNSELLLPDNIGKDVNEIIVYGGMDPDNVKVPQGSADIPTTGNQQPFPLIFHFPLLDTDAKCDTRAEYILGNIATGITQYTIIAYDKGIPPQIGQLIYITNTEYSLTAQPVIVQGWQYNEDEKTVTIFAINYLIFPGAKEIKGVDANLERLGILGDIVAKRTIPGLVYYLDNNASDVAGYKKMLDVYAGDALVTFTNTNAVNGEAIEEFVTEPTEPGITILDDGEYNIHLHAKNTQVGSKETRIYFEMYKRTTAPAETLLTTSEYSEIILGTEKELSLHAHLSSVEIGATDRIVVKLKIYVAGSGADPDVLTYIQGTGGDTTTSRFEMPSSSQVIANKVNRSGDTMTGDLYLSGTTFFGLPVKTTTGDPASPAEGYIYVNTFDNKVRLYADATWRDVLSW
jgi:hypothetical protein